MLLRTGRHPERNGAWALKAGKIMNTNTAIVDTAQTRPPYSSCVYTYECQALKISAFWHLHYILNLQKFKFKFETAGEPFASGDARARPPSNVSSTPRED